MTRLVLAAALLAAAIVCAFTTDALAAKPNPRTVVGQCATPEVVRIVGMARAAYIGQVRKPLVTVDCVPAGVAYGYAEVGGSRMWLNLADLSRLDPGYRCQIVWHEFVHLTGRFHQSTDPGDLMFSPDVGLYPGEGWQRRGLIPECWR